MRAIAFPPAMIRYTRDGLEPWQAGTALGPVVTIRPGYESDSGLLAHELEHVRQFWWMALAAALLIALAGLQVGAVSLFWLGVPAWAVAPLGIAADPAIYTVSRTFRLWAEVDAYRVQAQCYPDDRRPLFARFIAERYGLNITAADALRKLRGE